MKNLTRFLLIVTLVYVMVRPVQAMCGAWVLPAKSDKTSIAETKQIAFVGWDGRRQFMLLDTMFRTTEDTWIIQFMPFAVKPDIKNCDHELLLEIKDIWERIKSDYKKVEFAVDEKLQFTHLYQNEMDLDYSSFPEARESDFKLVYSPDVEIIAKIMEDEAERVLGRPFMLTSEMRDLLGNYIHIHNNKYFVYKVVKVGTEFTRIKPIMIELNTPVFYYPSGIMKNLGGNITLDMFALTSFDSRTSDLTRRAFNVSGNYYIDDEKIKDLSLGNRLHNLFQDKMIKLRVIRYEGFVSHLPDNIDLRLVIFPVLKIGLVVAAILASMLGLIMLIFSVASNGVSCLKGAQRMNTIMYIFISCTGGLITGIAVVFLTSYLMKYVLKIEDISWALVNMIPYCTAVSILILAIVDRFCKHFFRWLFFLLIIAAIAAVSYSPDVAMQFYLKKIKFSTQLDIVLMFYLYVFCFYFLYIFDSLIATFLPYNRVKKPKKSEESEDESSEEGDEDGEPKKEEKVVIPELEGGTETESADGEEDEDDSWGE